MRWFSASEQLRIEDAWPDAPTDMPEVCAMILDVARVQTIAYAEDGEPVEQVAQLLEVLGYSAEKIAAVLEVLGEEVPDPPSRYVFAQLQQAKNLYNAGRIVGDSIGPEGFSFVPRPLSREIRQIIRPKSGVASVL